MTPRQLQTLDFVRGFAERTGRSPSLGKIADAVGFKHRAGAYHMVRILVTSGHLECRRRGSYAIAAPDTVDLTGVPSAALAAELMRRKGLVTADQMEAING